ncbi:winged helix-turn-helix domain-containing protein [Pseudoalteromonas sp. OOF1S-7]|uniref:winged helix-turn-helix domain-containing protein n=1 Tax=Pseudoalteromonas sp. OOF1S-7 TaxID=2917757 RepID=UPI001EF6FC03|nr:winged helix-turn-helix domain-containing protein [Pseudoalteromonas sp. OOF1S-7]MCG7536088.1 winged helix-turn-helix domain-containing protein [Pseudoalteromonas sp. OOF1S-7]
MPSLKDIKLTKLGAFVLDLSDQVLYRDADEVAIEPKVMALLLYLYENRDRYVNIEELHQQVWSDRIVSDTAVRSAVKKLRLILDDNDIANARYVKSASKRGYKLVCDIEPVESVHSKSVSASPAPVADTPSEPFPTQVSEPSPSSQHVLSEQPLAARQPHRLAFKVFVLLATLIAVVTGWTKYDAIIKYVLDSQVANVSELEQLTGFNGEKHDLSVSQDGRYVAFSGRTSIDEDRQVYLLDRQNNKVRQLTYHANNAAYVQFVQNDKVLIYSDLNGGKTSVQLLPLTLSEPESGRITLIDGVVAVGDPSRGRHASELLLPMLIDLESEMTLYALDLHTREYLRMLAPSDASEILFDVSLSPDKQKLALIKKIKGQFHILLFDLTTKEETLMYSSKHTLYAVEWKDNTSLMIMAKGTLFEIDSVTGAHVRLIEDSDVLLRGFDTHDGVDIVLLQKEFSRAKRLYIEHLLTPQMEVQQIINTAPQVVAMLYDAQSDKHRWAMNLKDEVTTIGRMAMSTREMEPYYSTDENVELLDVSYQAGGVLFKEGPKLAFYSFKHSQVDYITSSMEISSDAAFSADGRAIYYGVNVAGEWEIQSYNIDTKISSLLIPGYRSIRPAGAGYIVAEPIDAQLFYLSDLAGPARALNHPIDFRYICRWYVRGDHIIWTAFDDRNTYLHKLNWRTGSHHVSEDRLFALYPTIATDTSGDKVLSLSVQLNDTSIATIKIDH